MKRYETYKNSGVEWIGEIPEGWDVLKLKYAFNLLDYLRQPISSENRSRNNPIYDYYGASGVIDRIDEYNVDDKVLLIGEDGANLVMRNLPLIYKAEGKFWVNNHAHILKPKDEIDYDYMFYTMEMADYTTFITGSAQPKLSQENLANVQYPIPSLYEQKQIASFLDYKVGQIDTAISKIVDQIDDLKSYRQSIISEAVTKGLNPNAKMKDSGVEWIGEIPSGWEISKIRYIINLLTDYDANGSFADIAKNCNINNGEPYAWMVRATDLENKRYGIVAGNNYCDYSTYIFLGKSSLTSGDILIAKRGEIGKSYIVPNCDCPMTLAPNTYLLKTKKDLVDNKYLSYYLKSSSAISNLKMINKSTTLGALYKEDVKDMKLPLPPLSEQQQIASYLDTKTSKIDSSIEALELQKSQLEDYKRSVISEAVTGKVDMRGWTPKNEQ